MASAERLDQPAEVASKVLRRAQVSKMTRALQNRLALANVKMQNGWQDQPLEVLESKIDMELKRKRPSTSTDMTSDTSSNSSRSRFYSLGVLDSSPLPAPLFSDDVGRSGSSHSPLKRMRPSYQQQIPAIRQHPQSSNHARTKVRSGNLRATSWKKSYHLPQSSPAYHVRQANFHVPHIPSLSFVSETSTVPDELVSPISSEEDDADLPIHSFNLASPPIDRLPTIHSSPPPRSPRTPPPTLARSARLKNKAFTAQADRNPHTGEEGAADLLMYFAGSPSPADKNNKTPTNKSSRMFAPPSTPPSKQTPLPSSMMNTPGFVGLATPGNMNFNFADYLNVTPSPAQPAWRTPGLGMTPMASTPKAARAARRRLNFDNLPGPGLSVDVKDEKLQGLGMQLDDM